MARPRQRVCLQDGSTAKPLGAAYSKLSSSQLQGSGHRERAHAVAAPLHAGTSIERRRMPGKLVADSL